MKIMAVLATKNNSVRYPILLYLYISKYTLRAAKTAFNINKFWNKLLNKFLVNSKHLSIQVLNKYSVYDLGNIERYDELLLNIGWKEGNYVVVYKETL